MANEIQTKLDSVIAATITLGSLAAGSGRASAAVVNSNNRGAAKCYFRIRSGGSAPTADTVYTTFLLFDDDDGTPIRSDGWAGTDQALTFLNSSVLGTIVVTNNTNTDFFGIFDTKDIGVLGSSWGVGVRNDTNQALNESGHLVHLVPYLPEIQ